VLPRRPTTGDLDAVRRHATFTAAARAEQRAVADLVREVYGNPFHQVQLNPAWKSWNNGIVLKLAQAAYDERSLPTGHLDPARLALLADALEDAGCTDAEILGHLRGPGPHVRGCWAVDLIQEKE
jgi:hypothetical protein